MGGFDPMDGGSAQDAAAAGQGTEDRARLSRSRLSAARPGARRDILESYVKRLETLEGIAREIKGVDSAFAIQAGRELRVIVEADKVTDADSDRLSFEIAQKIQTEMTFPGQIKVTVIREKRAVNVAR